MVDGVRPAAVAGNLNTIHHRPSSERNERTIHDSRPLLFENRPRGGLIQSDDL
jgi:hypothetical protein